MNTSPARLRLIVSAAAAVALAACGPGAPSAGDASSASPSRVSVVALESEVMLRPNAVDDFTPAEAGQRLPLGGHLRVGSASWAMLELGNGDRAYVGSLTRLVLERLSDPSGPAVTRVRLPYGKLWLDVPGSRFEAVTPSGVVSVEAAFAEIFYSLGADAASTADDVLEIRCLQGQCKFANVVNLSALEQLTVTGGGLTITGPVALPETALEAFLAVFPPRVAQGSQGSVTQPVNPLVSAGNLPAPTPLVQYGPAAPEGSEATSTVTVQPSATASAPVVFVPPPATPTSTAVPPANEPPPTQPPPANTPPPAPPPVSEATRTPSQPLPTNTPPPTNTPAPSNTAPPTQPPPTNTPRPPDTKTPPPPTETPLPTKTASPTPLLDLPLPTLFP